MSIQGPSPQSMAANTSIETQHSADSGSPVGSLDGVSVQRANAEQQSTLSWIIERIKSWFSSNTAPEKTPNHLRIQSASSLTWTVTETEPTKEHELQKNLDDETEKTISPRFRSNPSLGESIRRWLVSLIAGPRQRGSGAFASSTALTPTRHAPRATPPPTRQQTPAPGMYPHGMIEMLPPRETRAFDQSNVVDQE